MSTLDLYEARQQAKTEGREATVATDAAALTDPIDLIVAAFSEAHRFTDVPWLGPPGFLARRGDRALLFESDERQPWAIVLASSAIPVGPVNADTLDGKDSTAFIEHAIVDAKGDLIVGSAADAAIRKAVGANDTILVADSTVAGGVRWATKAPDADKLDGLDSTAFLGATAKAADSDKLDGIDSLGFLQLATAASRKIAFGAGTLTWTAGTDSGTLTVTHGLGATPSVVLVSSSGIAGAAYSGHYAAVRVEGVGGTTFALIGHSVDGSTPPNPSTATVYWLAIA